ncbi:MAG: hypothetical protein WBR15_10700 [Gammaproteobacteria bacterium]
MTPPAPEKKAREQIDAHLAACGWMVQDYAAMDFGAVPVQILRNP